MAQLQFPSKLVVEIWRWGTFITALSLLALVIPVFLVGYDMDGSHSFKFAEKSLKEACHTKNYHWRGEICGISNISKQAICSSDDPAIIAELNEKYGDRFIGTNSFNENETLYTTQTLDRICTVFKFPEGPAGLSPDFSLKSCVELDGEFDSNHYVSGYLYWCRILGWTLVGVLALHYIWQLIHFNGPMHGTDNLIGSLCLGLHPNFSDVDKESGKALNWLSHTLILAAIHTFSVILAVYSSLAHVDYDNTETGMNMDSIEKEAKGLYNEKKHFTQLGKNGCFKHEDQYAVWNITHASIEQDMNQAPPTTQTIFYLSIVVAAISGVVLFSYLFILMMIHSVKNGSQNYEGFRTAAMQTRDDFRRLKGLGFTMFAGRDKSASAPPPSAQRIRGNQSATTYALGAGVDDNSNLFGLGNMRNRAMDVPASVSEEKNGQMFTQNVDLGQRLMNLTF